MDQYVPEVSVQSDQIDFVRWNLDRKEFPVNVSAFDQILMLDIIEHLKEPERFMDELRCAAACKRPEVIITTANIGFAVTRFMLLFGQFNYGKKGILDATHTRLFTFRSLRALLDQSGYKVLEVRGIPAPFPKALGTNIVSRLLLRANQMLICLSKGLVLLPDIRPRRSETNRRESSERDDRLEQPSSPVGTRSRRIADVYLRIRRAWSKPLVTSS